MFQCRLYVPEWVNCLYNTARIERVPPPMYSLVLRKMVLFFKSLAACTAYKWSFICKHKKTIFKNIL